MTDFKIDRLPEVCETLGDCSGSSVYAYSATGLLTKPVKIGKGASGWPHHEVQAVIRARIAGATDTEIRALVDRLHAARTEVTA